MKNIRNKAKTLAMLFVVFIVFTMTFFAMAQSQNGNPLFLDSDQDGLTDQEEKAIGTNPELTDTDGDGYSDGKEVESGYNPLKAAPGDKLVPATQSSVSPAENQVADSDQASASGQTEQSNSTLLAGISQNDILSSEAATDLSSDPQSPNLTNEMIGEFMQLTKEKVGSSDSFAENPTFSSEDLAQVSQNALETVDITKDLPKIEDSEIVVLPPVEDKKLSAEEIRAKQKNEIEKYLAQTAFLLASNSPFSVEKTSDLSPKISAESNNLITAFSTGDMSKINSYAQKAHSGIDQLKKIEVPYVLKDTHKSILQLAIYTLDLKDKISLNASDPMKSLAAASSLQAVAENATEVQQQLSQILSDYGIEFVNFPS